MCNSIKNHIVIVMAIEHYNPLSVIRSLGKSGISPVYIAIKGKGNIASSSKYISKCYYADSVEEAFNILMEQYGSEKYSPFVLCTDDKTIGYLDIKFDEIKGKFTFFNAGKAGRIHEYMDKYSILTLAKKHNLPVLPTQCIEKGIVPEGIKYPVITKSISPLIGGWKSDVFICESKSDLENAYNSIKSPKVILQEFINKQNEYCVEGFSINHGEDVFLSISVSYNYLIKGYYSPYLTVGKPDNEFINNGLRAMIKEIGFEGIFEAEFLIDQDGTAYFEEINFRNSPWSYPVSKLGVGIPEMWMNSMIKGKIEYKDVEIPNNFTAMIEPIDYAKRVEEKRVSFDQWLYDFKKTDVTFYYDSEDPEPYFIMMSNRQMYS